jgi:hypothetical protein
MTVSRRLRYEVLRRDGFACRYCHRSDIPLEVDHVIPESLGGTTVPENLVVACADCNAGKASSTPDATIVAGVTDDALRWAAAMREAAAIQAANRNALANYCDQFLENWPGIGPTLQLPNTWRDDLARWFELGIEIEVLIDATDIAFRAYGVDWRWKYFCGVVWRRVAERQAIAQDILARDDT